MSKRLTRWNGKKFVLPQGYGMWRKIADRLAAYEETGLEPEEVAALKQINKIAVSCEKEEDQNHV